MEGGVLPSMGFSQLMQRFRRLGLFFFPAFVSGKRRARPQADNAGSLLSQTRLHALPSPAKDGFRRTRTASAVFERHLRLKRSTFYLTHLAGRRPKVFDL